MTGREERNGATRTCRRALGEDAWPQTWSHSPDSPLLSLPCCCCAVFPRSKRYTEHDKGEAITALQHEAQEQCPRTRVVCANDGDDVYF